MVDVTLNPTPLMETMKAWTADELLRGLEQWPCSLECGRGPLDAFEMSFLHYRPGRPLQIAGRVDGQWRTREVYGDTVVQQMVAHLVNGHGTTEDSYVCSVWMAQHAFIRAITALLLD